MSVFKATTRGVDTMDAATADEEFDLLPHPPLDEPGVALYVKYLLAWIAEHQEAGPIVLHPAEPLPDYGVGMSVTREKYRHRITYARVVHCLKMACHLHEATNESPRLGMIDAMVYKTSCTFRVTFPAHDIGVTVACVADA